MSASATTMLDFIDELKRRVPRDLHPAGATYVHEDISSMYANVDDPALVVKLAGQVRWRIARELRWEAETYENDFKDFREGWKLRHRADRCENVTVQEVVFGRRRAGKSKTAAGDVK